MISKAFYHLLGAAAWANERSSRYSNVIPANWIILMTLGVFLMVGCPELINAWLYGTPTSMNYAFMVCLMALTAVALLLFLATFCTQYIVFQKTASNILASAPVSSLSSTAPLPLSENNDAADAKILKVTGRFVLDARNSQRFLNVPASMKVVESGDIAFFSNINASITMYETIMLKERVGIWYLMMKKGSLSAIEPGVLYLGRGAQHSLRIHHTDAITSHPVTTIVSFQNESERNIFTDMMIQFSAP